MRTISLDDFIENINEEQLEKTYTQEHLNVKYDKYKKPINIGKIEFQIYMTPHAKERFHERFIEGEAPISTRSSIGSTIKFKSLPGWKSLEYSDLDKVLVNGINRVITKHKFRPGAYMIVSEGTRLVIPLIIARIEDENHKLAVIVNTFLHTGMSEIDRFTLGKKEYDYNELKVENRKVSDFFNLLKEEYSDSYTILEDSLLCDDELGIYLEYNIEGSYIVSTNIPLIVIE